MISTLGQGLILGALACSALGAFAGIHGGIAARPQGLAWARRGIAGYFACMVLANLVMLFALITHDFSVSYVAQVGSRSTPLVFTIVSLWSALEGSILFWGAVLGTFLFAFERAHRADGSRHMSFSLGVMLAVGIFFALLIAAPANPFHLVSPPPPDGPGPNALLQNHWLMIVHPPMLYLGYVGMAVPFGIAVGGLLAGELSESWMGPLRRWTLAAWVFLTLGIIMGAWWAYAVLGWGGYWAWDPVENASFLPWLTASAFVHSTLVHERRRLLKVWTITLALATFLLTILGTFMTRSGIFNSVHAFTQSDIGPTFLIFIAILVIFCVVILSWRGHLLVADGQIASWASREAAMLLNNLVLSALTFTVLLGTTFPLISEAVRNVKVSVGEPYFNKMAVPCGIAILFLMGAGPVLPWGAADLRTLGRQLGLPTAAGVLVTLACLAFGLRGTLPLLTFGIAGFVTWITVREILVPVRVRMSEKGESPLRAFGQSALRARRRFGGYVVHLGIVIVIVAIAASRSYVVHETGTVEEGKALQVGPYQVTFLGLESGEEPHRSWIAAKVSAKDSSGAAYDMSPRLNFYERSTDPVGTPDVRSRAGHDLYLSLMAYSPEKKTATLNAWVFPLVGWIWWSMPVLVFGALFALWPPRRRMGAAAASLPPAARAETSEARIEGAA